MSDMTETPSDEPQAGAWLPLQDAARFLKVTVRTIDRRRMVKRHRDGHPVEVWVPGATSDDVSDETETEPDPAEQAMALSERVSDVVRQHTAPLLEALERSEARARDLEREAGRLAEQNAALRRVVDTVRQMSEADRHDADTSVKERDAAREAARIERERRLEADAELARLKARSLWKWWTW